MAGMPIRVGEGGGVRGGRGGVEGRGAAKGWGAAEAAGGGACASPRVASATLPATLQIYRKEKNATL